MENSCRRGLCSPQHGPCQVSHDIKTNTAGHHFQVILIYIFFIDFGVVVLYTVALSTAADVWYDIYYFHYAGAKENKTKD